MKTGNYDKRLVNDEIKAEKVKLISENGKNMGVQSTGIAVKVAREAGLDLVQLADDEVPPAKMMNWSREKYLEAKRNKRNRRVNADSIKEIRLGVKICTNDLDTKIRQCKKFLSRGCKVRFNVRLHGREANRPEEATDLLGEVLSMIGDCGSMYGSPSVRGKIVSMMIIPSNK